MAMLAILEYRQKTAADLHIMPDLRELYPFVVPRRHELKPGLNSRSERYWKGCSTLSLLFLIRLASDQALRR